ncbi:MAG: hypothetical protein EOO14_02040 [Chitinophagaceae bacterium]|nr:MAG: hypothetical protein EOO14_02040 [Chitinophagaceae bacterium]
MGNTTPPIQPQPDSSCYHIDKTRFWTVLGGVVVGVGGVLAFLFTWMHKIGYNEGYQKFDKEKVEMAAANATLQRQFDLYRDSVSHANGIAAIADAITEQGAIRDNREIALRKAINDAIHNP